MRRVIAPLPFAVPRHRSDWLGLLPGDTNDQEIFGGPAGWLFNRTGLTCVPFPGAAAPRCPTSTRQLRAAIPPSPTDTPFRRKVRG